MAWRRPGDKPLSEAMMASLLKHICVTRPQWVNPLTTRSFSLKRNFIFWSCSNVMFFYESGPVQFCEYWNSNVDADDLVLNTRESVATVLMTHPYIFGYLWVTFFLIIRRKTPSYWFCITLLSERNDQSKRRNFICKAYSPSVNKKASSINSITRCKYSLIEINQTWKSNIWCERVNPILSIVATGALVLKHQVISTHSAD